MRTGTGEFMATIHSFLPNTSFEPEVLAIMGEAFDRACQSIDELGHKGLLAEIIAGRIIRLARAGERDVETLCAEAVKSLGLHSDCEQPSRKVG